MAQKQNRNFETAISRLEEIIDTMNSGKVSLDESLKLYEEANDLIIFCDKRILQVEHRITELTEQRSLALAESVQENDGLSR